MKYHEEFPKVSSASVCYGVELIENFFSKKDCEYVYKMLKNEGV
jgi:hypothetical protein